MSMSAKRAAAVPGMPGRAPGMPRMPRAAGVLRRSAACQGASRTTNSCRPARRASGINRPVARAAETEGGSEPRHGFLGVLQKTAVATGASVLLAASPPAAAAGLVPPASAVASAEGGRAPVLDYGNLIGPKLEARLAEGVQALEASTAWKLRVLTTYNQENMPSFPALQDYWGADSKTVIMSWDEYRGNVLEFYYSDRVYDTIPRNVFQELRGRYGNKYFIAEEGTEKAIETVTQKLGDCVGQGGCKFVPGLSQQQREFSLVPVISGGFLSGAALRNGSNKWSYLFLFIWVPWIVGFGFYPLYIRQPEDITPLLENLGIFATIFALCYLTPLLGQIRLPGQPDEDV